MPALKLSDIWAVVVSRSRRIATLFYFLVESFNKPDSFPYWNIVALYVRESHIIHEQESMLKEYLFITRCQAKKTRPQVGAVPPNAQGKSYNPSMISFQFQVHSCPYAF